MATVGEFKKFVMREYGGSLTDFVRQSGEHLAFWTKLNDMGKAQPGKNLTEQEWKQLEDEFRKLPR